MGIETLPLLPRMEERPWACGTRTTYRYHPPGQRPVNLGSDRRIAIAKAMELSGVGKLLDPLDPGLLRETLDRHRKGAKQRGIDFSLTLEDLASVISKQGNRCAVTKLKFNTAKPHGLRIRPWLPSIDRRNSKRGYEPKNVRVVCAFVNVAMNGFGEELFRLVLEPLVDEAVQERLRDLENSRGNESF